MSYLLALVSGFVSGIFFRSVYSFGWQPVIFIFLLTIICVGIWIWKPRHAYVLGSIFFIFVIFGMMRTSLTDTPLPGSFAQNIRHRVSYNAVVTADPDIRDASQRVELRVSNGNESTTMLAIAHRYPRVMVGDTVHVSGTLSVPKPFSNNGRTFHYDKYLQRDGVRFLLNFASLRVINTAPWYSIPAKLAQIKHLFLDGLSATLPEPQSSLAGGIVIGGKTGLGKNLQNDFIRSGLVQIIVLSGYNIMVVAEWVLVALAYTKLSKRWAMALGAVAVLVFVGIAGISATALRAALMAFIALYARATGRTYTAGRALFIVVFIMLLYNPLYLVYDPGFDLSVVATAGLIWLAPIIENNFILMRSLFWKNAIATTLAAQVAVLPLLLYYMGLFSLVAIPANLLAMPIVPLAMGLSALAGIAGAVFSSFLPLIGIGIALPAYFANSYLIYLAQYSSAIPFASFTLPAFPFWLVLVFYALIIFIASLKRFSTTPQFKFAKNAST